MHRRSSAIPIAGRLIAVLAVFICPSCRQDSRPPDPRGRLPDARVARQAVERSLEEWRDSPPLDLTTPKVRPVMFADQQRRPGQRLRDFAILGDSEADGYRRFQVRLSLADPDESILAAYYVFGEDPIWVYRAEDFDMIMHMDKSMMPATGPAAGTPGSGDALRAGPGKG